MRNREPMTRRKFLLMGALGLHPLQVEDLYRLEVEEGDDPNISREIFERNPTLTIEPFVGDFEVTSLKYDQASVSIFRPEDSFFGNQVGRIIEFDLTLKDPKGLFPSLQDRDMRLDYGWAALGFVGAIWMVSGDEVGIYVEEPFEYIIPSEE